MSHGGTDIGRWVPGLRAARTDRRQWVRPDIVAGIVLAAILVPQGMAYAELAGRLQELVRRDGLVETLDRDRLYPTLLAGLAPIHEGAA